jgi:hypothetical protein
MKRRLAVFVNELNLHSTIREQEVHGPEFGVFKFCVPANYGFLVLYLQFICV